jgi:hypothetical protein
MVGRWTDRCVYNGSCPAPSQKKKMKIVWTTT